MYNTVHCLFPTPVPSTHCESSYHLAITIVEFPDNVHLISLKYHFDACLECQVTVLSKLNNKKKKYWFLKEICSPAGFESMTSWMQSSFLHFFVLNPLQNAIWSPHYDDGLMILGSWYVDVGSPRWVIGMTDRRMAFQLYIYTTIDTCPMCRTVSAK